MAQTWDVRLHPDFEQEILAADRDFRGALLAQAQVLEIFGPGLGRPDVDTLKGSKFANMKELRFAWQGGVWRVAFAFDPERQAILLVAGDKRGVNQRRFYQNLIGVADARYATHLQALRERK
ncbi:MAG: type II toxin-antitoxin system RelE/ParE family toxin [Zoogloeaceae bacterium]|jgi:hypothetical protein|nr:type II toxin-antitoxin system RelE/ParE family toxin [Zoogloeaceae bacterium]